MLSAGRNTTDALRLDYDAIVPKGTTVWIVTDIHKDEVLSGGTTQVGNQLVMKQIGAEGDLIPAGTAMYVRSDTKAGLYDFQKAWKHELLGWDGPNATSIGADTLWYNKVLTDEKIAELAAQREKIGDRNLLQGSATPTTFANKREALVLGIKNQKGTGMIGFWPFNGTGWGFGKEDGFDFEEENGDKDVFDDSEEDLEDDKFDITRWIKLRNVWD